MYLYVYTNQDSSIWGYSFTEEEITDLIEGKKVDMTSEEIEYLFNNDPLLDDGYHILDENNKIQKVNERMIGTTEITKESIRSQRNQICFPIINRGKLWYDSLTSVQYEELQTWYTAWLNATETLEIPTTPEWLESDVNG